MGDRRYRILKLLFLDKAENPTPIVSALALLLTFSTGAAHHARVALSRVVGAEGILQNKVNNIRVYC